MLAKFSVANAVLCAAFASAQTDQHRVFHFNHTANIQQVQEIATLIRAIGDIKQLSVDEAQNTMTVHGTSDQIALASWLFNEFDRPGNQQPPQTQSPEVPRIPHARCGR